MKQKENKTSLFAPFSLVLAAGVASSPPPLTGEGDDCGVDVADDENDDDDDPSDMEMSLAAAADVGDFEVSLVGLDRTSI